MKKWSRFLAVLLAVTIMITGLPITTFAEENTTSTQSLSEEDGISPETKKQVEKEVKLLGEVKEKREKNSKQFLTEDKIYLAVVYPSAVHYKEGTEWKDIDNSLSDGIDEEQQPVLENKKNSIKVKLAKDAKSKKLVRVKKMNLSCHGL